MFKPEEWKTIEEADRYKVSNYGRIRNWDTGRFLKPLPLGATGDVSVHLFGHIPNQYKAYMIKHLVAQYFLPGYDPGFTVVHLNAIMTDNHISNLIQDHGRVKRVRIHD